MNCGIYRISIGPRTYYYGQSQDLRARKNSHLNYLRRGEHNNGHLQASFDKHGEDTFRFVVILCCEVEDLDRHEQFFLDKYFGTPGCANVAPCAEAPKRGMKHSEQTKDKLRKKQARPVRVTSTNNTVREFSSAAECSRSLGLNPYTVGNWLRGNRIPEPKYGVTKIECLVTGRVAKPDGLTSYQRMGHSIEIEFHDGTIKIFQNQNEAARYLIADDQSISNWVSGKHKPHKKRGIKNIRRTT